MQIDFCVSCDVHIRAFMYGLYMHGQRSAVLSDDFNYPYIYMYIYCVFLAVSVQYALTMNNLSTCYTLVG